MAEDEFTLEEIDSLMRIQHHIKNNPSIYRKAGRALDLYCFGESYRRRRTEELAKTVEMDMYAGTSGELEEEFELYSSGSLPPLLDRIEEVWNSVFLNYHMSPHLDNSPFKTIGYTECLTILIIVWLATDQEASYCNLNLTQFEKWPWSFRGRGYTEEEEEIYGSGRNAIIKTLFIRDNYPSWKNEVFDMLNYALEHAMAGKKFNNGQKDIENKTAAETGQKTTPDKKPKAKKRGRSKKHTDEQVKRMIKMHERVYQEKNDSRQAWNDVGDYYGITSSAAKQACYRYRKNQNK